MGEINLENRLTLLYKIKPTRPPKARYICKCGKEITAFISNVNRDHTRSCGCLSSELVSKRNTENATHGHWGPRNRSLTYKSWQALKARCLYKKHPANKKYKNIELCERWLVFENFLEDIGERPIGKTLDRIENEKGYYKENCRWATHKEQMRNTSKSIKIIWQGELKSYLDVMDETKCSFSRKEVLKRISRGENPVTIFGEE